MPLVIGIAMKIINKYILLFHSKSKSVYQFYAI